MVEQWSPKPKVKGSNPFSPGLKIIFCFNTFFFMKTMKTKNNKNNFFIIIIYHF